MNKISYWWASKNATHQIVFAAGLFTSYLAIDAKARNVVGSFLDHHTYLSIAFGFASFCIGIYKRNHKDNTLPLEIHDNQR